MKKRGMILLAMLLALALLASGCAGGTGGTDNSWKAIKDKGTLVVGIDILFPPMGFMGTDGNVTGVDIDLANAVCEKMGVKAEIKPIDWDSKEMQLDNKNIDCIWNGFTITEKRQEKVLFSTPYMQNYQIIIVPKDSAITKPTDLAGKKVGLQSESSAMDALRAETALYQSIGDNNIRQFNDNTLAMLDLDNGGIDAVIVDEVVGLYYLAKVPDNYRILEDKLAKEDYGIGFRKNDKALKEEVEKAFKALQQEGKVKEIAMKWFGEENIGMK